jgi:hypothetical protein
MYDIDDYSPLYLAVVMFLLLTVSLWGYGKYLVWKSYQEPVVIPAIKMVLDQGKTYAIDYCDPYTKYGIDGPIVKPYKEKKLQELQHAREQALRDMALERKFLLVFALFGVALFVMAIKIASIPVMTPAVKPEREVSEPDLQAGLMSPAVTY